MDEGTRDKVWGSSFEVEAVLRDVDFLVGGRGFFSVLMWRLLWLVARRRDFCCFTCFR